MSNVHGFIASQGVQIPNQQSSKPLRDRRAIAELARITPGQTKRLGQARSQERRSDSPIAQPQEGEPLAKKPVKKTQAHSLLDPNESDYNSFDDTTTTLEAVTGGRGVLHDNQTSINPHQDDLYGIDDELNSFIDGSRNESDLDFPRTHSSHQEKHAPIKTQGKIVRGTYDSMSGRPAPKGQDSPLRMAERLKVDQFAGRKDSQSAPTDGIYIDLQYRNEYLGSSPSEACSPIDSVENGGKGQDKSSRAGTTQPNRPGNRNGAPSIFEAQMQSNHEGPETEQNVQNSKHTQLEASKPSTPGVESPLVDDLDYDPTELSSVPYSKLENQSFDEDPKAKESVLSAQWAGKPLTDQLMHASSLSATSQKLFLDGLSIDQWDEAGEWFVQQFSELVGKLSVARRAKRKVAERFEDEINERQKKVMRRNEHIDSELQGMKLGGTSLLERHNTPKHST